MPKSGGVHRELYSVSMGQLSKDLPKESRYPLTEKKLRIMISEACTTARDLHYPESVLRRLSACKNEAQITNVMVDARKRYL